MVFTSKPCCLQQAEYCVRVSRAFYVAYMVVIWWKCKDECLSLAHTRIGMSSEMKFKKMIDDIQESEPVSIRI